MSTSRYIAPITIGVVTLEIAWASAIQARSTGPRNVGMTRPARTSAPPSDAEHGRRRRVRRATRRCPRGPANAAPTVSPNRRPSRRRQSSWNSFCHSFGLLPRRLRRLVEQERAEHEIVDVRPHEAAIRVLRRADDRLAADVERGVDEHAAAGARLERLDQVVVAGVRLACHGLDARRVVDVRDRRDVRPRHVQLVDAPQLVLLGASAESGAPSGPARRAACTGESASSSK